MKKDKLSFSRIKERITIILKSLSGRLKSFGKAKATVLITAVFLIPIIVFLSANTAKTEKSISAEVSATVDASSILSLEQYGSGVSLDLSGSTCYPEIEKYINDHPEVNVHYDVDLGGFRADSSSIKLELESEDYIYTILLENLRYLPDLKQLSLPNTSLNSAEITEIREKYPDLNIVFSYDIGNGKILSSSDNRIVLKPGEYSFDRLIEFLRASSVQRLTLNHTSLDVDQLALISELLPENGLSYTIMLNGKEYSNQLKSINLSFAEDIESEQYAELLRRLPNIESIELTDSDGKTHLSLSSILALHSAAPTAEINCVFELFGKKISTSDSEIIYKKVKIGNEGIELFREVLPLLNKCERLVLDDCGIDNEVMASLRDDFPDKKIVWRVHWQKYYSALTDVTIIRSGSYIKLRNNGGVQNLKYCTEVVFADLGHNRSLSDISFLAYWKHIRVLLIDEVQMTTLDALSGATELQLLEIVKCYKLTGLEPLANCKNLRFLNFSSCSKIKDLSPLYGLEKLEQVYAMGMHKMKLKDKNQRYEIQEKLPNCKFYFKSPPNSQVSGLYSVGWRLVSAPNKYAPWYKEISSVFKYRKRPKGEGIFNYPSESDSLFYHDEDKLTVFTADRSQ